jgi:two-component system response regulator FixJ
MEAEATVFVVDDDADLRKSVSWLLKTSGLKVETFASAERFLEEYDPDAPGCVLVDLRMPGMSGLDLQQRIRDNDWPAPVIIVTGHADVPTAVRALEEGAAGFIEKPFSRRRLVDRIQEAIEQDAQTRRLRSQRAEIMTRLDHLTPRQREVMNLVVAGGTTKEIAARLGASARTVEVHRKQVMAKLGVESLAELVTIAVRHGLCETTAGDAGSTRSRPSRHP